MIDERRRAAVIDQITAAFADVKRGNGITLHEAHAIDYHHPTIAECAAARLLDLDTCWQDVPEWDMEHHYSFLSFLDAEGFHYYAPACMIWTTRYFDVTDSVMTDMTIYTFGFDGDDPSQDAWQLNRWSLFTDEQRSAVCAFLHFMVQNPDSVDADKAEDALTSYWGQFCTSPVDHSTVA